MEAKTDGKHFTGLEIQPESADMARRSVALNDLQDRIDIVEGDIEGCFKDFWSIFFSCRDDKSTVYDRAARTDESA